MKPTEILLRSLLTKAGWELHQENLAELAFAADTNLRTLYHLLPEVHALTQNDLQPAELGAFVRSSMRDEKRGDIMVELVEKVAAIPVPDPSVIQEATRRAAQRGLSMQAVRDIAATVEHENYTPRKAFELLQRAVEIGPVATSPVILLSETGLPNVAIDRPNMCSLALSPKLDAACGGGAAAGELIVFLGGPKMGKTAILCAIGAYAAKQGKNVLHITLELSSNMTARRYDKAISGSTYEEMQANPGLIELARQKFQAEPMFVDWQYEDHSPADIIPILESCRKMGRPVDLIIIDYLQLMVPDDSRSLRRMERRHLYSFLGKDARGVAKYAGVPVISAWQVNREGAQQDVTEAHHIAESWDIPAHVDILLGLSRTSEEKLRNEMSVHTILSRFESHTKSVKFHVDFSRMKFEEI